MCADAGLLVCTVFLNHDESSHDVLCVLDAGLLVCTVFLNHDESSHDVLCVLTLGFWSVLCF